MLEIQFVFVFSSFKQNAFVGWVQNCSDANTFESFVSASGLI